jgi:site-specific DNA-cytosine methylase
MPDGFIWPASVPKTARYRIIGNGWASLMARRMSEALAAADPESRTVIDLFCGGGVGAVGWHRRAWESVCTRTAHERGGKSARLTCQVDVV